MKSAECRVYSRVWGAWCRVKGEGLSGVRVYGVGVRFYNPGSTVDKRFADKGFADKRFAGKRFAAPEASVGAHDV